MAHLMGIAITNASIQSQIYILVILAQAFSPSMSLMKHTLARHRVLGSQRDGTPAFEGTHKRHVSNPSAKGPCLTGILRSKRTLGRSADPLVH